MILFPSPEYDYKVWKLADDDLKECYGLMGKPDDLIEAKLFEYYAGRNDWWVFIRNGKAAAGYTMREAIDRYGFPVENLRVLHMPKGFKLADDEDDEDFEGFDDLLEEDD